MEGINHAERKKPKEKRKIKRTTIDTMPYEAIVGKYIMLLNSNVRIGNETTNLYSKTYEIPDVNYFSLPEEEQIEIMQQYMDLLNGFDTTASFQLSLVNQKINRQQFKEEILLKTVDDDLNDLRTELNGVLEDKIQQGQSGMHCKKYITVTVAAVDLTQAGKKLFNMENHLRTCLTSIGTEPIPLDANARVRLMTDILCGVEKPIVPLTIKAFQQGIDKEVCCPDSFEFKKDYFMIGEKYARCVYFKKLRSSMQDTIFQDIVELNQSLVITENVEFVEPDKAVDMLRRKITDMKVEEQTKITSAVNANHGAFVDPLEGTKLAEEKANAKLFLEDLQSRNQKMTLCQFIIMLTADSMDELRQNTEALNLLLRPYAVDTINAPYRQEQAFYSAMPVGNSMSIDKEHDIQVRRTLSTESTAVFNPFNAREFMHKGGLCYGVNQLTHSLIMFDRRKLDNPNGFLFGIPGAGKGMNAKLEILFSALSSNDEILIVDPEREYSPLAELLGGEVIYISSSSETRINPLDLTENPDPQDKEYDPIKSKLSFLLSFFATILEKSTLEPIEKTVIDAVMQTTYKKYPKPTLKEYYTELETYVKEQEEKNVKDVANTLKQALRLYTHGSMNMFSEQSNVNIHKRIVVYDIKSLDESIRPVGLNIMLENIWNRMAQNRQKGVNTRIYIDEMYLMFKSEQSADFFYTLWKRARKWGGIPTGITQNVDDLLRSPLARTMVSNTQFVILLKLNTTDREQLSHLLQIPEDTMKYVTNNARGTGLLFADNNTIPFDNRFPENTRIYDIISTKFEEKAGLKS